MTSWGERLVREARVAIAGGAGADAIGELLSRAVAPWVAHDGLRLGGANPAAGLHLGMFSFWHGYEPELGRALLLRAYAGDGPCRPVDLVRQRVPVGIVDSSGGGERRDRVARVLAAHGAACELRCLLRDARGVWGMISLLRAQGGRIFDAEDASRMARLAPSLVLVARQYMTAGPLVPAGQAPPAGVVVVGPDDTIRVVTAQARAWLDERWSPGGCAAPDWIVETYLIGLSMRTRQHLLDPAAWRPLVSLPATVTGRYVAIHGQPMDQDQHGQVAIVIESASGALLLPSFCDWYGITPRERQAIECLCDGDAPKRIARRMGLSLYTVNDHLKAVFRKTGASGRDELVAALGG